MTTPENERPRTVPEIRGVGRAHHTAEREPDKPYSAVSYAAQYGITIEDAEDLVRDHGKFGHAAIERQIHDMLRRDLELRRRALMLDDAAVTEEDRAAADRIVQGKRSLFDIGRSM